jgi:CubicO group peptidase (beta-lactamase class C family)
LEERVRAAVDRSLGTGLATAYSVAVWRDGEVIYAEAFGETDPDGTPATTDTLFQIGSDTKKMTAVSLLRKVDEGLLSLDDTVAEQLPSSCSHRSGVLRKRHDSRSLASDDRSLRLRPVRRGSDDSALRERALGRFARKRVFADASRHRVAVQ